MGLGWDGWDGNARTTSGRPGRRRTRLGQLLSPPTAAGGLGKGTASAGGSGARQSCCCTPPGCQNLGKSPAKSPFLPVVRVVCPHSAQERLGFPCQGSGGCSLVSRVAFVQVKVEVGLERGSQKLWNLQNHFHHLKIKDLPGLPARLQGAAQRAAGAFPFPFPRLPSPPGSLG